jgi:hypothetical protein
MIDTQPITRRRGDTYRIRIGFTQDDGTPLPLDGTFVLVVTEQSAPAMTDPPVMELAGTIVEDGQAGADAIIDFQQSTDDADHVGEFYYEVENTTAAGDIRTILEGPFTMTQDRAKTDFEYTVLLDSFGADGTEVILDGDGDGFITNKWDWRPESELTAETRDAKRVLRWTPKIGETKSPTLFMMLGTDAKKSPFRPWRESAEIEILVYLADAGMEFGFRAEDGYSFIDGYIAHATATGVQAGALSYIQTPGPDTTFDSNYGTWEPTHSAGWYRAKFLLEQGYAAARCKHWPDGEAEPAGWEANVTPQYQPKIGWYFGASGSFSIAFTGAEFSDLAEITVRTWRT